MKAIHLLAAAASALPLLGCASIGGPGEEPIPTTNQDGLVLYCGGLDALLPDERDQGLERAFDLLGDRAYELSTELGASEIPWPALELLFELLACPASLRGGPDDGSTTHSDAHMGPPFYAQLAFEHERPEELAARFADLLSLHAPLPSEPHRTVDGLQVVNLPPGPAWHGVLEGEDGRAFVVGIGDHQTSALGLGSMGLPGGVEPVLAMKADLAQLVPLVARHPEVDEEQLHAILELVGLGPEIGSILAAVGFDEEGGHGSLRVEGYARQLADTTPAVLSPLPPETFHLIPADATWAEAVRVDLSGLLGMVEMLVDQRGADLEGVFAMIEAQIGLHPEYDLLDHLGHTAGGYCSMSTGGGGLTSLVVFLEVAGPHDLWDTLTAVQELVRQWSEGDADGRVALRTWRHGETEAMSLRFPGLPVPVEPSFAISKGWLLAAATPMALVAAIEQQLGEGPDLSDRADFRENGAGELEDLVAFEFSDTGWWVSRGYGLMGLGMSAVANALRSPVDPDREPGLLLPPLSELVRDAHPWVAVARIEGEDYAMRFRFDRSWMVNATAVAGNAGPMILAAMGLGTFALARVAEPAWESGLEAQIEEPPEEVFEFELDDE